eukprot:6193873-Pleurochrysis_carterae.AAC.3
MRTHVHASPNGQRHAVKVPDAALHGVEQARMESGHPQTAALQSQPPFRSVDPDSHLAASVAPPRLHPSPAERAYTHKSRGIAFPLDSQQQVNGTRVAGALVRCTCAAIAREARRRSVRARAAQRSSAFANRARHSARAARTSAARESARPSNHPSTHACARVRQLRRSAAGASQVAADAATALSFASRAFAAAW